MQFKPDLYFGTRIAIQDTDLCRDPCLYSCFKYLDQTRLFKTSDKAWMTPLTNKALINDLWYAFRHKNWKLYNHLKTKVKNEILNAKQSWAKKLTSSP